MGKTNKATKAVVVTKVQKQEAATAEKSGIQAYEPTKPESLVVMSAVIKQFVADQKLAVPIGGKQYVQVEGWQLAGTMIGWLPTITEEVDLSSGEGKEREVKWKVTVELRRLADDKLIGRASAICSNKEAKKRTFDEYAILSMAQTRAIGKVYRNSLGWVMKAAGYNTTPAEEVPEAGSKGALQIALEKIEKVQKIETLDVVQSKLNASDKYDEEDQAAIQAAIDYKREELQRKGK